jgi:hypothetical protein
MVSSSQKTWRYLDAHLVLPMLDFVEEHKLASESEILNARIKAVSSTAMVDYLTELYQEGNLAIPEDLASKKAQIMSDFQSKQSQLKPLLEVVEKNGTDALKVSSLADFCLRYDLSTDVLDILFDYSRLSYQIGDYKTSSELLKIYRILTTSADPQAVPTDKQMRAMWGSVASYIAQGEWTAAAELIGKLIEFFETSTLPKDKFSYGASGLWLIHWATLVSFKLQDKTTLLPQMMKDRFLNIISISAPYLWRYMSALILLAPLELLQTLPVNEMATLVMKDAEASQDPLNRVVIDLFHNFNFEPVVGIEAIETEKDYYLVDVAKELPRRAKELTEQIRAKLYQ